MTLIDLKPVKRCRQCGHLIPANRKDCPYCNGEVRNISRHGEKHEEPVTLQEEFKWPRISAATFKKLLIGVSALIVLLVGFKVVQYVVGSRALNHSILEELSENDIEYAAKDDEGFRSFYNEVSAIREKLKTTEDKEKYGKITYNQLREYLNHYGNPMYCNEVRDKARDKYQKDVYAPMHLRVDSVMKEWNKFIDENDVSKYLIITIHTSYYNDGWYSHPSWYFTYETPKGHIVDCTFTYQAEYKGDEGYNSNFNAIHGGIEELNKYQSKDNMQYYTANYNSTFWEDYDMKATVTSVTMANGKTITADDIAKVPNEVSAYNEDSSTDNELNVIKTQIDQSFPSLEEYSVQKLKEELKTMDPLCYELVEKVTRAGCPVSQGF